MRYIEVERVDPINRRHEFKVYDLHKDYDELTIMQDSTLIDCFCAFVDAGIKQKWTKEQILQYKDKCYWCFYCITEEEFRIGRRIRRYKL